MTPNGTTCEHHGDLETKVGKNETRLDGHDREMREVKDTQKETIRTLGSIDRKVTQGGVILGMVQALLLVGVGAVIRFMLAN